ncbi:hypothetical protein ACWGBY_18040 [Streptomyces griseus]|uniref:Uncharacterized protein n=1 Tax=Streptomyces sp. CMC78 TaxID=3231512 RepID=A0AB33KFH9_9ACTN|nr:hypothetical protein [Streptomyces sp. ID01-9D]MDX5572213.1 hypothetical protein [Streptomyces sp. ID01-9D]WSV24809.1 hypothetical protein OG554_32500 [Streptomyces fimicarius]WTC86261.1 hypothetical protein OH733_05680 [Streptomyces griseus]WTD71121.1 hypothetical protein OH763_31305 [Streptomyces griseus]
MKLDDAGFQPALAVLLSDPRRVEEFLADPQAYGAIHGLEPPVLAALGALDLSRLRTTSSLLRADRQYTARRHYRVTFSLMSLPAFSAEVLAHPSARSVYAAERSDALSAALLELADRTPPQGPLWQVADMIRFENMWYRLATATRMAAVTDPVHSYGHPRLAPNVAVEQFRCRIGELYREVRAGSPPPPAVPAATSYLAQAGSGRGMRLIEIPAKGREVLALCDGTRSTDEIARLTGADAEDLIEQARREGFLQ